MLVKTQLRKLSRRVWSVDLYTLTSRLRSNEHGELSISVF